MSGSSSPRSPWFVPIVVALITALGGITAAAITQGLGPFASSSTPAPDGSSPVPAAGVPPIAGSYYLDADTPWRTIVITSLGGNRYSIEEPPSGAYPFRGEIGWNAVDAHYEGTAAFATGTTMKVVIDPMPNGHLVTTFDYIHDDTGVTISRTDKHELVPAS